MATKIGKGKRLEELVKGSLEYTQSEIANAFRTAFPHDDTMNNWWYIVDTFADYVIVAGSGDLKPDEYFKVTYTRDGENFSFAARDAWEVVELNYQPQTPPPAPPQMAERNLEKGAKKKGKRFEERLNAQVSLQESEAGKPKRIKIDGAMTAGVVNGNMRRYPAPVISAAVNELKNHLHESNGQGMAVQVLGEAEHPSDKGGRANFLETVVKWEDVTFDGGRVDVLGRVLETSKGKDILTLMEGGVMPGVSLRGYGEGKTIKDGDNKIFEVTELHITGFDLVLEPSFANSAQLVESIQGDEEMNLEELLKLLREHPEAFAGITESQIKKMGEDQLKKLEDQVRSALGIGAGENITESLKSLREKAQKFEESQKRAGIDAAIVEACKDLPFGKELNEAFVESIKEADHKDADGVKKFAESKRKEYAKLAAKGALKGMGFDEKKGIVVLGDVLETQTGTPEYARASFELTESMRKTEMKPARDWNKPVSKNEIFTKMLLERFDALHKNKLIAEARLFNEAEQTSDLNLPYSVSRALIEEAFPNLVAAGIFDVGIMNNSPERMFFETFSGESGYTNTVTDEVVTGGAEEVWYSLDFGRITPGTVVVTSNPAGTTYTEGTDYVIDYAGGRIKFLTGGSINTNDVLVDYGYTAIRKGEMAVIERGKMTLSYMDISAAADRLADQISKEAIVFSRSQLGWDAVARTMANLVKQMRRKIDQGLLYAAYSAVKSVASNSGGTWTEGTTQTDYDELVRLIGVTKLKVYNRYYEPTFILASATRSEDLSNWYGFKRDGFTNAVLNAAGFVGNVKGLPLFASTEMPDDTIIVGNRQLVMHRVFQPMLINGPYPTYDVSGGTSNLIAADQYYAEEFNNTETPVEEKGAYLTIAAGS